MKIEKVFKTEFLKNELDLPWAAKEDKIVDQGRWNTIHEIVFEHEGKHYLTYYSVGSTESQYEQPWEYEEEVMCVEVEKKEVLIEQWVPVEGQE